MEKFKKIAMRLSLSLLCIASTCSLRPMYFSNFLGSSSVPSIPNEPIFPNTNNNTQPNTNNVLPEDIITNIIPPIDPPSVTPETFYVQIHMKGESPKFYFRQVSANAYPDGIEFQIMDLNQTYAEYFGRWWIPEDQCHQIYGYSGIVGNYFDIKKHIGHPNLKTIPNKDTLHLYYWIKRKATSHNFARDDLYLTVPKSEFDSNIHTNIARYTVTFFPDYGETRQTIVVFDGFVSK